MSLIQSERSRGIRVNDLVGYVHELDKSVSFFAAGPAPTRTVYYDCSATLGLHKC